MKKSFLVLIISFAVFTLSACGETSLDEDKNKDTPIVDDTPTDEIEYEKDGDVVKYFKTFGEKGLCGDGSDYNNENCYIIEETFEDGMSILMRFYDIEGSVYLTFDFIAKINSENIEIQTDYEQMLDTKVKYYQDSSVIDGWLQFNGYDQTPLFELNQSYEYTVSGDNTIQLMQSMLNKMVTNLDAYYQEFVGGPFLSTE